IDGVVRPGGDGGAEFVDAAEGDGDAAAEEGAVELAGVGESTDVEAGGGEVRAAEGAAGAADEIFAVGLSVDGGSEVDLARAGGGLEISAGGEGGVGRAIRVVASDDEPAAGGGVG